MARRVPGHLQPRLPTTLSYPRTWEVDLARRAVHPIGRIDNQPTVISKQPPASMTPPLAQLPPVEMGRVLQGQTLGHYELLEFVGGGGMGAVFGHDTM